jgi:hypothetical protein
VVPVTTTVLSAGLKIAALANEPPTISGPDWIPAGVYVCCADTTVNGNMQYGEATSRERITATSRAFVYLDLRIVRCNRKFFMT